MLGLSVQTLDSQLADELGVATDGGVVITQVTPGSLAAAHGLRSGMVIKEVDRKPIRDAREFTEMVETHKDARSLLMLVQHDEHTRFILLRLEK